MGGCVCVCVCMCVCGVCVECVVCVVCVCVCCGVCVFVCMCAPCLTIFTIREEVVFTYFNELHIHLFPVSQLITVYITS